MQYAPPAVELEVIRPDVRLQLRELGPIKRTGKPPVERDAEPLPRGHLLELFKDIVERAPAVQRDAEHADRAVQLVNLNGYVAEAISHVVEEGGARPRREEVVPRDLAILGNDGLAVENTLQLRLKLPELVYVLAAQAQLRVGTVAFGDDKKAVPRLFFEHLLREEAHCGSDRTGVFACDRVNEIVLMCLAK